MNKGIKHLKKHDSILKRVIDKSGIIIIKPRNKKDYFKSLVRAIIGQQLSVKAAQTITNRFIALFRGKEFPTPEEIIKTRDTKLREAGLSSQKISYIKDLSKRVVSKEIDFGRIEKLEDEDAIGALIQVKGIGRWTAEMFLMFSLGRQDVFSHGDLGLKNAMKNLYGLRKHPSFKKTLEISKKWIPYRTLACRYLWASSDNKL